MHLAQAALACSYQVHLTGASVHVHDKPHRRKVTTPSDHVPSAFWLLRVPAARTCAPGTGKASRPALCAWCGRHGPCPQWAGGGGLHPSLIGFRGPAGAGEGLVHVTLGRGMAAPVHAQQTSAACVGMEIEVDRWKGGQVDRWRVFTKTCSPCMQV